MRKLTADLFALDSQCVTRLRESCPLPTRVQQCGDDNIRWATRATGFPTQPANRVPHSPPALLLFATLILCLPVLNQFKKTACSSCICRVRIEFHSENRMFCVQVGEEFFKHVFR